MIERTTSRIRTRFIAVSSLIVSLITFGSGLLVFLYMKSPAFENQLLDQVMKHMDWIIDAEFEEKIKELKPRPVPDPMIQTNGSGIILKNVIENILKNKLIGNN